MRPIWTARQDWTRLKVGFVPTCMMLKPPSFNRAPHYQLGQIPLQDCHQPWKMSDKLGPGNFASFLHYLRVTESLLLILSFSKLQNTLDITYPNVQLFKCQLARFGYQLTPDRECGLTRNFLGNATGVIRVCRHANFNYWVCLTDLPAHNYLLATDVVPKVRFLGRLNTPEVL